MTPDDPPEDAVLQAVRRLYDGAAAHYDRDEPAVDLTLLDASPAMLAHSGDVEARRVVGDVTELPFRMTPSTWS